MRMCDIRQMATASATEATTARRTTAPQPSGMPVADQPCRRVVEQADERRARQPRRRDLGDAGERRAEQALDEEHDRQRPHRGAPGDAADGDEQGDVGDRPGSRRRSPPGRRWPTAPATRAASAHDGPTVTVTTNEPPSHRPTTMRHMRTGRQPREVERPRAHLGAEHGVADDERGDRHRQPEDRLGGDVGEAPLGSPAQRRATAGRTARRRRTAGAPPPTGAAAGTTAACSG